MKKLFNVLAVSSLILAGCTAKTDTGSAETDTVDVTAIEETTGYPAYYCGTIPAADAEGAFYGIAIAPSGAGKAMYRMRTNYVGAPKPGNEYTDSGTVTITRGIPGNENAVVYRLNSVVPGNEPFFFEVTDSSMTMLGSDLMPAASGLDYTLRREF